MSILKINAHGTEPRCADGGDIAPALVPYLARLSDVEPVIICTHGLRHSPFMAGPDFNPHLGVLASTPARRHWKARSFVRQLHMGQGQRREGQAIAFGWDGAGMIWPVMTRAAEAGAALARLCMAIRACRPELKIGIVTHSLGARVVLEAMIRAPMPAFDRVLLLTPAEHRARAGHALAAPGGQGTMIVSVQTPENWLAHLGFAAAFPGWFTCARGPRDRRWVDFVPDRRPDLGVARWSYRTCHWSSYLRPGLWRLYRGYLNGTIPARSLAAPDRLPRRHGHVTMGQTA